MIETAASKSFAERLGLMFLPGVAQAQGGLTGIENPLRVALLPTLQMGGALLHNVVVMVLDDANLNISLGKQAYQINGIIGYPVFQALGTITFLHDSEFEAGDEARAAGTGARMYMNHLTPIVECKVEGRDLPFSFDTGADSSDLLVRYYQRFHSGSKAWEKSKIKIPGAGGVVKRKIYIQPQVKLGIGDKTVTLQRVPIHTSGTGTDIADDLGLQRSSVADHSKKLYQTLDVHNSTELGTKIWLNPHQDQARQVVFPAPFSRMGFVRDKLPYRSYAIASNSQDEKAAGAMERYARRGDGGGGAASKTPVAMAQLDSRIG